MLTPNTVLQNRYQIIKELARGGMGAVYEAKDNRLGIGALGLCAWRLGDGRACEGRTLGNNCS